MAQRAKTNKGGRRRRRVRTQSVLYTILGLIIVASFVLRLIK